MTVNNPPLFVPYLIIANNGYIATQQIDGAYFELRAQTTGGAPTVVQRVTGAATPFNEFVQGFIMTSAEIAAEGAFAYNSTSHKGRVRAAAAWETINSA